MFGLNALAVVWMFSTFATKDEYHTIIHEMQAIRRDLTEIRVNVGNITGRMGVVYLSPESVNTSAGEAWASSSDEGIFDALENLSDSDYKDYLDNIEDGEGFLDWITGARE